VYAVQICRKRVALRRLSTSPCVTGSDRWKKTKEFLQMEAVIFPATEQKVIYRYRKLYVIDSDESCELGGRSLQHLSWE